MLNEKERKIKNVKNCVKVAVLVIGGCTIWLVSYRLGAQHGIDMVEDWILRSDPNLYTRVDALYKKCFQTKGRG